MNVQAAISIGQLVTVVLLIITILLQQKGVGLGSAFGGGDSVYTTKRGPEKFIFYSCIVLSIIFIGLGLIAFFFQ